jgi:hypothetical protein
MIFFRAEKEMDRVELSLTEQKVNQSGGLICSSYLNYILTERKTISKSLDRVERSNVPT